jgi:hypothetical protein
MGYNPAIAVFAPFKVHRKKKKGREVERDEGMFFARMDGTETGKNKKSILGVARCHLTRSLPHVG